MTIVSSSDEGAGITAIDAARLLDDLAESDSPPSWMGYVHSIEAQVPAADEGADIPTIWRAIQQGFGYFLEFTVDDGRPRVELVPRDHFGEETWPPPIADVEPAVRKVWDDLAALVQEPLPRARLNHLGWEAKSPEAHVRARQASEAYLQCAKSGRNGDRVQSLTAALRLAKAVKDSALIELARETALDFAKEALDNGSPSWATMQSLELLAQDADLHDRVGELATKAASVAPTVHIANRGFALARACLPASEHRALWEAQVARHLLEADAAEVPLLASHHLHEALRIAEKSCIAGLREQVSARLQAVSRQDLGLLRFQYTSHVFDELSEQLVDTQIRADDWAQALDD